MRILLLCLLIIGPTYAQMPYQGPIAPITSGYGANGNIPVSVSTLINDHWLTERICVFYPTGTTSRIPTLFYSHGYGANDTLDNIETLRHLASRGYAVVFVPYKTVGAGLTIEERYLTLHDGFNKAARNLTNIIDTTRVGFIGHSFGGGATPRLAYRAFTETDWGANGKFIYCSAPWYSFELGTSNLIDFPSDCKMITILYDDDETNDHRMGMDIFNHIAIDNSMKDCITVFSNTVSGYTYEATHHLPAQNTTNGEFDALDFYVTARLVDALADYTFTGNTTAQNIALGNGSAAQIDMGGQLLPLAVTDDPSPAYARSKYLFPCDTSLNERIAFCQDVATATTDKEEPLDFIFYPNPSTGIFSIQTQMNGEFIVHIYNQQGAHISSFENIQTLDLREQPEGIYFVSITNGAKNNTYKIMRGR